MALGTLACEEAPVNAQATEQGDSLKSEPTPQVERGKAGEGFEFETNGKDRGADVFTSTFRLDSGLTGYSVPNQDVQTILSKRPVKLAKTYKQGKLEFSRKDFKSVSDKLGQGDISGLKFYAIEGEDKRGNVHFTGYFTPVMDVRETRDTVFEYPIYAMPRNLESKPSRGLIDTAEALAGMDLELAYSDNLFDVYTLHVQGSGVVRYPDGEESLFRFAGNNGHKYVSLGRHLVESGKMTPEELSLDAIRDFLEPLSEQEQKRLMAVNPSYVFFQPSADVVKGAESTPLHAGLSVAADPNYLPLGSILLMEVPVLDETGRFLEHTLRWGVVQDVGGAIKGPGHIDLYCGRGEAGEAASKALHHYGKVWLVLPE